MYVVAITELRGSVDAEATALGADLGCTPYDARLAIAPGLPAIVRHTPSREDALALLARLRARGHDAVACDTSAVIGSSEMVSMRRFRFGDDAIELGDSPQERLPYRDVIALVAAVYRSRTDTATRTTEQKFSVGKALLTSGLSMTKTVKKETHVSTADKENVLLIYRKSGESPWLLREHGTAWAGHGEPLAPSEAENFRIAVAGLRRRVPAAAYDDRLVTRRTPERTALSGAMASTTVRSSSDAAVDLLAHLLAMWLAKRPPST